MGVLGRVERPAAEANISCAKHQGYDRYGNATLCCHMCPWAAHGHGHGHGHVRHVRHIRHCGRELLYDGVHVDSITAGQPQAARNAAIDNFR